MCGSDIYAGSSTWVYFYCLLFYTDNFAISQQSSPTCLPRLQSIEEVGGYVLIALNTASRIPLENLRIIRGHSLYERKFALAVLANIDKATGQGTSELLLTNLTGRSRPSGFLWWKFFRQSQYDYTAVRYCCFYSINVLLLTEILKGGVKFGTQKLCNVETIQWYDIVNTDLKPTMELPMASNNPLCKWCISGQKAKKLKWNHAHGLSA